MAVALFVAFAFAPAARADGVKISGEKRIGPREVELTISTPAFTAPTYVDIDLPDRLRHRPEAALARHLLPAGTMNTYRTFNDLVDG